MGGDGRAEGADEGEELDMMLRWAKGEKPATTEGGRFGRSGIWNNAVGRTRNEPLSVGPRRTEGHRPCVLIAKKGCSPPVFKIKKGS